MLRPAVDIAARCVPSRFPEEGVTIRLLFLASDFPPAIGGIQTYLAELCRALAEAGQEPVALSVAHDGDAAHDSGAPFEVVRVQPGSKAAVAREMGRVARGIAGSRGFDAVVAGKWFLEGPVAVSLARALDIPSALMGYGNEFALHGANAAKAAVQRQVLRSVDVALAISHYTAGELVRGGTDPDRTHVIGAGVRPESLSCDVTEVEALRRRLGIGDEKVILTVGRLVARKGHQTIIRALRVIRAAVGPVRYVIVGTGPNEAHLRRVVQRRHPEDDIVTWAGHVPETELSAYYHLCDLFAMTSRQVRGQPVEGLGLVYLEANACTKPVLGADTGGVSDAIEQEANGLLIAPGDIPSCAAAAIKILGNPEYAAAMGQRGRERVEREFLWPHVAERFMQALTSRA